MSNPVDSHNSSMHNSSSMRTDLPPEMENLSEEEREEIFSQIDQVATGGGLEKRGGLFSFTPEKRGSFFPILVNILALFVMAGGIYYADRFFSRQEKQLNIRSDSYLSAEGKIIEEFKKESERRLQAKESEIEDIKQNLQQIEEEREALAAGIEQQIEQREEQLHNELQAALREERERLEARGIGDSELENRLREFQENRREEIDEAIASYRNEMEEELAEKAQELAKAEATAERILEEANRERQELIEETREREAELQAEFEQERERLSTETSMAREELEELSELRKNEQLILDQITSMYLEIKTALQEGESQKALDTINSLRELINSSTIKRLRTLSERREVDSFLLATLEEYVNKTQRSTGDTSLLESAKRLSSARAAVESAHAALEEGDRYSAQRYFTQALTTIPEIETAHNESSRLSGLNRGERMEELFTMAEELRDAGELEEALERLNAAASEASPYNSSKVREATSRLQVLLTAEYERRIDELKERAEEESERLQSRIAELEAARETLEAELAQRESELAAEESQSSERIEELQEEMSGLREQYATTRRRVEELRGELDQAAEELADLVSRSGSSNILGNAVSRYTDFREEQRQLLNSGEPTAENAARQRFQRFLRSEEISSIFPGLPELYERSHPDQ